MDNEVKVRIVSSSYTDSYSKDCADLLKEGYQLVSYNTCVVDRSVIHNAMFIQDDESLDAMHNEMDNQIKKALNFFGQPQIEN